MASKFGKTWWGEHWLQSLDHIDYENRLPRGASYARNGYVEKVTIKENNITAKVRGSRRTPYKVNIIVPPFFEEDIERLIEKIIQRPALISKLLNRELDPEILTIAEELGLKVFPRQWTDFKMQCSCPDWAVPCKHLAAVVYMISREIDNNPFLVFELHRVNLIEELKNRGIFIEEQKKTEITQLSEMLKKRTKKQAPFEEEKAYEPVHFAALQPIADALIQLLPDAPPFYPGTNFKEKYREHLLKITRYAKRLLTKKLNPEVVFPTPAAKAQAITHRTSIQLAIDLNNRIAIREGNQAIGSFHQLPAMLFSLNKDRLPDYQPSVAVLHQFFFAALHLVANGAIIPQIVQQADKNFIIRWLPALIDKRVKAVVDALKETLLPDLLLSQQTVKDKEQYRELAFQTTELLSVFISELVHAFTRQTKEDPFEAFFFKGTEENFKGVGENAISGGIKVWTDRYFLTGETYKPIITVNERTDETFEVEISVENTSDKEQLPIPLNKILTQKQYEKQRFKILQTVSLLTPFIRGLDTYINLGGNRPILFDTQEFAPFLMEMLPAIRLLDIKTMLPKALQELLKPKASVKIKRNQDGQGFVRIEDLLSFDWQVAIGDQVMSPEEFKRLLRNASGLIRFKERYIYVDEADLEKLHKHFSSEKPLGSYQLLQTVLAEDYEGAPITLTDEVKEMIKDLTSDVDIPLPQELNAQLRPYQQRGYSWMYKNSKIGFGSIIADDMGLGKTLQVISILLKFKEENAIDKKHRILIVVPTGLLTNWQAEINKFAPSLSSHIYHGAGRKLEEFDADILLTSYGVVRSDFESLKKHKWLAMVIDEAQNIKNHDTAQAKAIKSIGAQVRIAMSGTPVENRLSEFWSIMDFTNKGYLGTVKAFKENYAEPIQVFNDELTVKRFRKVTAPFMMRRMKSDKSIISDLPDKLEQNQFAALTQSQASLYEKTMQMAMDEIEGIAESDLFKRQGLILQMILALKQICNHPTQFLKNGKFDASLSGKITLLFELLDSIIEAGEKVLIFTQFKEMGDLLQRFIAEHTGDTPLFYHGGCSLKQRQEMVERFQHNRADKIFILSLKAAGTGLNLTAASHVIHYDLWWNPAVENQATDRAYRIGQKKNVMVHRMITRHTFEEKIDEMIQRKKQLAEMTVATGENWIGKLSNKELKEIFG